eukprot:Gregarina_sp_Poly_1__2272@NODE_1603_length_3733_cov_653_493726_g1055_i0_p3_GENE_NODE_1603_length_3733_cov_653_493726_g1055_i0NODE_1603_length_3733_cov_653_493726_g1055_i0_p3_ORF_typecomplete_len164_score18_17SF3A2/PF16835_5/0_1_NODE_1603_length_3733_cov_653_493726_g1055_i026163107
MICAIHRPDVQTRQIQGNPQRSLPKVGYEAENMPIVAISGFICNSKLENAAIRSQQSSGMWSHVTRHGLTLVEARDEMKISARCVSLFETCTKMAAPVGRIEKWDVAPTDLTVEVKSEMRHELLVAAAPGRNISFNVKNVQACEFAQNHKERRSRWSRLSQVA